MTHEERVLAALSRMGAGWWTTAAIAGQVEVDAGRRRASSRGAGGVLGHLRIAGRVLCDRSGPEVRWRLPPPAP